MLTEQYKHLTDADLHRFNAPFSGEQSKRWPYSVFNDLARRGKIADQKIEVDDKGIAYKRIYVDGNISDETLPNGAHITSPFTGRPETVFSFPVAMPNVVFDVVERNVESPKEAA